MKLASLTPSPPPPAEKSIPHFTKRPPPPLGQRRLDRVTRQIPPGWVKAQIATLHLASTKSK